MCRGLSLPNDVDDLVLRGEALRTWSGPEGSSHKEPASGAAGTPGLSSMAMDKPGYRFDSRCTAILNL